MYASVLVIAEFDSAVVRLRAVAATCMGRVLCVRPGESVRDCAAAMARNDIGAIPVAQNNLLIGMVTDRDLTVRAVAANKGPPHAGE